VEQTVDYALKSLKVAGLAFAAGIGLLAVTAPSNAATYTFAQTSDHSTDGVLGGAGPYDVNNFISVTAGASGGTQISLFLDPTWSGLISTGASPTSFAFGLSGVSSLNFTAGTPSTFSTATGGVQVFNTAAPANPQTGVLPTTITANGKFSFANDGFGITENSNGGSTPLAPNATTGLVLQFTLTNISLSDFIAALQFSVPAPGNTFTTGTCGAATTGCFYVDVQKSSGLTGVIDFGDETLSSVPLPATLPLFATGIGGLGLLGWRRKNKAKAVAA
jgi:hypothetical protein